MVFLALLVLVATLCPTASAREHRLCGSKLTKAIREICKNRLNPPKESNDVGDSSPAGVARKCCSERCTMEYLRSFCAPDTDDY
ncbi:unnamed protein product, partial [Mesorhabditis spiculigera]